MAAVSSVGTAFTTGATAVSGIVTAISIGGISTAEIDVTSLASTFKTYVMGTLDGGTVTVTVNHNAGEVPDLPVAGSATPTSFVLRFGASGATGPTFSFDAYVQNLTTEAAVDAVVSGTYTLRISSTVTVA